MGEKMDIILNASKPCHFNCQNCYLKFNDFAVISDKLDKKILKYEFIKFVASLPENEKHQFHFYYMEEGRTEEIADTGNVLEKIKKGRNKHE